MEIKIKGAIQKNILIISKSNLESTTENVIDWLISYGVNYYRLNGDIFETNETDINIRSGVKIKIKISNFILNKKYHSIWIRRWSDFKILNNIVSKCDVNKLDTKLTLALKDCIAGDINTTKNLILSNLNSTKQLTTINQLNINKINVLIEAKRQKLNIPSFLITNRKNSLVSFYKEHGDLIVKDYGSQFRYFNDKHILTTYGVLLNKQKIAYLPNSFFLSFFQKLIDKEYEIRTFYLVGKFYSMAIFSQSNKQTKVDFRRYVMNNNENRTVPYKLPIYIEKKLTKLMSKLNLQTGSIDLIKGKDGKYYFLEVNPVGQFGMISVPCNYNIEQEIANYLIN